MSHSAISLIWRASALQPHRTEAFNLPAAPLFIEKVRNIVGLYLAPPEKAQVLCVDGKAEIQALERTVPLLPRRQGQVELRTHHYSRDGTTALFAALDIKTGQVIGTCHPRHRSVEFRNFLYQIDIPMPTEQDVHLILDNHAIHETAIIQR